MVPLPPRLRAARRANALGQRMLVPKEVVVEEEEEEEESFSRGSMPLQVVPQEEL